MTMYEQSQQSDWLQTELESMSLQAASPAKTSQSQETKQESQTERAVDYGQSAPVCLGSFDPDTPSLKTSQTCLMENGELGLSEFSGTFPRSGMMRSGTVYQLPNLARTITEIGSGLWSTPLANDNITASMEAGTQRGEKWTEQLGSSSCKNNVAYTNSAQCQRGSLSVRIQSQYANIIGASGWGAEPDVGRVANGIPSRSHRLKCLGNAVVPPIPELIGRAINGHR